VEETKKKQKRREVIAARKNGSNNTKSTCEVNDAAKVPRRGQSASKAGVVMEESVDRKPLMLYYRDHRHEAQLQKSLRIYYCDICWQPVLHNGGSRPYEGNYVNKTWNIDPQQKRDDMVTREQLYQAWKVGLYDLTWHCLDCHAKSLGRADKIALANEMGLNAFGNEREKHKQSRRAKGFNVDAPPGKR
jgi:hypothetical protein